MTFLGMECLELVVVLPPMFIIHIPCKVEAVEGIKTVLRQAATAPRSPLLTDPIDEWAIGTIPFSHFAMTFLGMERLELVVLFPPLCIQSIPCKVEAVEGIKTVLTGCHSAAISADDRPN